MTHGKYTHLAANEHEAVELEQLGGRLSPLGAAAASRSSRLFSLLTFRNLLVFLSIWCVFLVFLYYYNFGDGSTFALNRIRNYFLSSLEDADADASTGRTSDGARQNRSFPFGCDPINNDYKPYSVAFNGVSYPKSVVLHRNRSINFECLNRSPNVKRILLWTQFFNDATFGFGELGAAEVFRKNKCPVVNCELTNDKNLLSTSDLVLVHMRDLISPIPSERPRDQRWVFVLYESPVHAGDFRPFNGKFNLTSTYRRDGDFPGFYESDAMMRWEPNPAFNESANFLAGKKRFAAIVVSNCGAANRRLDYVRELQRHIQVDIFGKCGTPCPTHLEATNEPADCKYIIGHEYKFYFAFENSNCLDYTTEKFFTILQFDVIPVVLGGGAYDHYIPSSGYINVLDYETPKKLADYLIFLSENAEAYNAYFKWKKHVRFDQYPVHFSSICGMCIQMHLEEVFGIKRQVIDDIGAYWSQSQNCIVPKLGI